ncbi:MAG: hypothetical protein AAGI01_15530, partial [Myxococcota bacterium]
MREHAYALEMDTGRMGVIGLEFLDDEQLVVAHGDGTLQCWKLLPAEESSAPRSFEVSEVIEDAWARFEPVGVFSEVPSGKVERASPTMRASLQWEFVVEERLEISAMLFFGGRLRCLLGANNGN